MPFFIAKESMTGLTIRQLLPTVILLPFILVALDLWGLSLELYSPTTGIILIAIATSILFLLATVYTLRSTQRLEKKFLANEKISRLLVENRKDYAIFMMDPTGKIIRWNNGCERLMGYTSSEIIGKNFSYLFPKEDQEKNIPEQFLEETQTKKQIEREDWHIHKNGDRFWAFITITAIFNEKNILIGYTKLIRNATRQKEVDEKLKKLVLSLEQSNKELERFAYIASHDLQEPLRMVASFTQLLAKKYENQLDTEAQEYIKFAVDGTVRMQQLIIDLLTYSRISTKGKSFTPTNCNTILERAIRNLNIAIEESHAEITHTELPTIAVDDTQMLQVFQNLISNAIKFHKKDLPPKISISSKLTNEGWHFSFEDNGIGITPEFHEHIFFIFQRLHGKQEYPGTGIGLAICKKIIERHGGRLWLESELGTGATFYFIIPT